ncbi:MAG: alpha-mannosidase [Clostridia bacterium]|nr:alpha-mannosidase [Clostridia bacterium]
MKNLHLVCNAHIDPVWLWEIEEGVAETLSTFRIAADFCENYKGFVFNHNEALLYKWVEEYDPELFGRIQKLVSGKKWHIMGGWYLQPDCNMPSGESFVRQILLGKKYFMEKFGVEPTTAINFDAFGHSRGLVEIMKKANYNSYLFCRPEPDMLGLPGDDFRWEGFCGSTIAAHRAYNSYESHRGEADEKIKGWMSRNEDRGTGLVLWGIGNHGGGPSRVDYEKISRLNGENAEWNILHSTPENYFRELLSNTADLPVYSGILNPRYTGCYTSQIKIKMLHRKVENELFVTEKMFSHVAMDGFYEYPKNRIEKAADDLMLLQFHDILPGSSTPEVEEYSINLAGHALEELKRLKTKAFLALCTGQEKAEEGMIPIMAYNPHPYPISGVFECEFQMADQNKNRELFAMPIVFSHGEKIPSQVEHESSNFNVDWRKKSVFAATLQPNSMNRFDIKLIMIQQKPDFGLKVENGKIKFSNGEIEVEIDSRTGTIDRYARDGFNFIKGGAFLPIVITDDDNSWAHKEKNFRRVEGSFNPMSLEEGNHFSGIIDKPVDSIRVIEDGEVRSIVETVMKFNDSFLCQRYYLPKHGTEIKVTTKVYWNEKMKMLKMSIPTSLPDSEFVGQTAYGQEKLLANGDEMVSHKWNIVSDGTRAVSLINTGTYGSDCLDGELRATMLRSPGYSAGKSDFSERDIYLMPQDRFSPYIDQGEHDFEFYFNAGKASERFIEVEREAQVKNEKPMLLSFFPNGKGKEPERIVEALTHGIVIAAIKKSENEKAYVFRVFNPLKERIDARLKFPAAGKEIIVPLKGQEFKTLLMDTGTWEIKEADLLERELAQ